METMELKIAHLYPDLLNLYGDRGNILCLSKRCEWRGIQTKITEYQLDDDLDLSDVDILFLGGGSDREQQIVTKRLLDMKSEIQAYVENGGVLTAICGGYQLIGHYYNLENEKIKGLSLVDSYTEAKPNRLIGNIVIKSTLEGQTESIVGFENHAGRTYIGDHEPLGKVVCGFGNNAEDQTEGILYHNIVGTYLHGPLFPKNPKLADFIIKRALQQKCPSGFDFPDLDDTAENTANEYIVNRFAKK